MWQVPRFGVDWDLGTMARFDALAPSYPSSFPSAFVEHVVNRKLWFVEKYLGSPEGKLGFDVGSGPGWYSKALEARGATVVPLDFSINSLSRAHGRGEDGCFPVRAAIPNAPLRGDTFDFGLVVNVLHHLPSHAQGRVVKELVGALRPGGRLFTFEICVNNPLVRFYMSHVFPRRRNVDDGTEKFLTTRQLLSLAGGAATCEGIEHFFFVPDVKFPGLLRAFANFERLLERTFLRTWCVQQLVVYRKAE
ncbi:MAG: hypothetical protein Kow0069_03230 [Promethearchaeota archaeon]